MVDPTSMDTEELIESMGRFRRWVLPTGVMRELMSRGPEIAPALQKKIAKTLVSSENGLEPRDLDAFFCFHLLGPAQTPCRDLIGQMLRCDDDTISLCTGEVSQDYVRALIASFVDRDNPSSFCEWIDSLVQDDQVNGYGKFQAVASLYNLIGEEVLPDAEAVRWLRKWLDDRKELQNDEFSAMILADFVSVGGEDLKELAMECFERDQIDEYYIGAKSFTGMSKNRQVDFLRKRAEADRQLLMDPISFLQSWASFTWTADSLDPQAQTMDLIEKSSERRDTKPVEKHIEKWLAEIDRASFDYYPLTAISESYGFAKYAIDQLKERVQQGVEWTRQGKAFSSNGPYLAAMMLADNCDGCSVMLTDPGVFLEILDLTSGERYEWFGDSIDSHVVEAVARVSAGKTEQMVQRLGDSSRSDMDRASYVNFFPISVYLGFLSRDRCLEILKENWASCLRENEQDDADCQMRLGSIYDAFCMLSVPEDDPIMRQAAEAGIENLFLTNEDAATFRTDPSKARDIMSSAVLCLGELEKAIKSGTQFDFDAIKPPLPTPTRRGPIPLSEPLSPPAELVKTIRNDGKKVGRNDPCTCGSGKKFKKCCGRG